MTRAIIIPTGGHPYETEVDGLEDLQAAVDGCIEAMPWCLPGSGISVYVNGEGKLRGDLAPNRALYLSDTRLTRAEAGTDDDEVIDIICGDAVCVGFDEATGEDVDLNDKQCELIRERFGTASSIVSGIVEYMRIRAETESKR